MLESVDLKAKMSKAEFKQVYSELEIRLGELQRTIRSAQIPVIVVFEGWEASGVGTAIGHLLGPFDPRGYKVHTFIAPTETEKLYPPMWRYWQAMPARGAIAVYDGSWYVQILAKNDKLGGPSVRALAYERIRTLERQLTDDGTVVLKFWLHISKDEQAHRFKKLKKDPALAWKVTKEDWRRHRQYGRSCQVIQEMLRETSLPNAPWVVVPAHDQRYASARILEGVASAMEQAIRKKSRKPTKGIELAKRAAEPLAKVDVSLSLDRAQYQVLLPQLQKELLRLENLLYPNRIPVAIIYEGSDAGGKGGNIKRLLAGLDHRGFEVTPIGPPEGEEKTHHYLWRFWKHLPKGGHITVFDRSWYGRVLVERVQRFATPDEWRRAYQEINEFEAELTSFGTVLLKFWMHISKAEQLKRFKEREGIPYKQWKITPDDWRNRKHWNDYYEAVSDMLAWTSTPNAPWTVVEGNDKLYARVKTLQTVCDAISRKIEET
jgi:polyphosphate:AMP phosphotransferase